MRVLQDQPMLTDLHHLIDEVPDYPITAGQLVGLAEEKPSPQAVIDFYKSFPKDEIFEDKFDLLARTDQVETLHHQSAPLEEMHAPEED